MREIGEIIKEHRKNKKLTQEELGKMVFVSKQAVSKWETGRNMPDIDTLRKLSEILDINHDEILGGTVAEVKRGKKRIGILIVLFVISLLCTLFVSLGGMDFVRHHTQSGITLLTVYENGKLLSSDNYAVRCDLTSRNAQNGYIFNTGYGEIRGDVTVEQGYEIEYGFINTNNWHNIQISLNIQTQEETVYVKQTVTYQTDNDVIEVLVAEKTANSDQKITVFYDGVS